MRSSVGAPIVVEGRPWGVIITRRRPPPLPVDTEARLAAFTELVATAISNAQARSEIGRLAEEQAALRRVATLVAEAVPPSELFDAVTQEVGRLLGADLAGMIRYESEDTVAPVAAWAVEGEHPALPDRWSTEEGDPATQISNTLRPARIDDWEGVPGPIAAFVREPRDRVLGRQPDHCRGQAVGRPRRPLETDRAAPRGHRVAPVELHRAGRHGDVERSGQG